VTINRSGAAEIFRYPGVCLAVSLAVVACIFSLVGFESATALGGEARNPLRNVPRAVIWSLILTGLFFVLMSYVEVYGTRHDSTSLGSIAAPLNVISGIYGVSYFKIPLSLGAMISFLALAVVLERRIAHHLPDGTAPGIPQAAGQSPRYERDTPRRDHCLHRHHVPGADPAGDQHESANHLR